MRELMELPDNRIILPVVVDGGKENKIEIVPHKASMGYLHGYADPEYIENLQTISLPFLGTDKYRAFPVEGDSMPPHQDGAYIIGKYVERTADLKKGKGYVLITRNEGITYKKLHAITPGYLGVRADNPFYEPYNIPLSDILEIWEYACSIATREFSQEDFSTDSQLIIGMFRQLQSSLDGLKSDN